MPTPNNIAALLRRLGIGLAIIGYTAMIWR